LVVLYSLQANNNRKTLELTLAQVRHDLEEEMNERQKLQVEVEQLVSDFLTAVNVRVVSFSCNFIICIII